MSYRTILVQLANPAQAPGVVTLAREIAREFEAHLIGMYVFPAYRVTPPIALPFGSDVAGQIRKAIEADVAQARKIFEDATANMPFVTEWRSITSQKRDACDIVMEHGRAADLLVVGQSDPTWDLASILEFPDRLAIESGRPVLVVPRVGRFSRVPQTIVVGWNNRREAARAVADAMPLLRLAKQVFVVTVDEGEAGREGQLPDTEIGAALARNGVTCEVTMVGRGALTAGEALRSFAAERSADLLVMGAYGQSRLREMAFGGATRHLLRDMSLPVLFSH